MLPKKPIINLCCKKETAKKNLISCLSFLSLDGLQLLLVVGAHITTSAELPASIFHLMADQEKKNCYT